MSDLSPSMANAKLEGSPEEFVNDDCHFPCSSHRDRQKHVPEIVAVCNGEDGDRKEFRRQLSQKAWALLLRSYTGRDHISFALVPNFETSKQDEAGNVLPKEDNKASILRYHIAGQDRVRDILPLGRSNLSPIRTLQKSRINTALTFSEPQSASFGLTNGHSAVTHASYNETNTANVSIAIRVRLSPGLIIRDPV